MTPREFFYTVAEMRACQKAYFSRRDPATLRAACKLERIIDAEIDRVRDIVNRYDLDTSEDETADEPPAPLDLSDQE